MKKLKNNQKNEQGFVLVASLMIMLVLTIIGIAANRNTTLELGIAGNDRTYKDAFYRADGGTELASEIIEQNLACLEFTVTPGNNILGGADASFSVVINDNSDGTVSKYQDPAAMWRNFLELDNDDDPAYNTEEYRTRYIPSDTNRDFWFPDYAPGEPHTNFRVAGNTELTTGAAIQMAAGYEGIGFTLGSGGAMLVYDINVQRIGRNNSETNICIQYRHSLGKEGDCFY